MDQGDLCPLMSEDTSLKRMIDAKLLKRMAAAIKTAHPEFPERNFIAVGGKLAPLELKQRVALVSQALAECLPSQFPKAAKVLLASLKSDTLRSFDLWPYTDYVQTRGLGHFGESMHALETLTTRFTSEFAIRPFLKADFHRTYSQMLLWSKHPNEHVRRLASEGLRPRLPWGEKLGRLVEDPSACFKVLEQLRTDPSEYVRKSVANHLNDISKDHPERVVHALKTWSTSIRPESQAHFEWIRRHALRTLIKQGHAGALALVGVSSNPKLSVGKIRLKRAAIRMGEAIEFECEIRSRARAPQTLVIDYVILHRKANGSLAPKVFKLKSHEIPAGKIALIQKRHSIRPITTRKYYSGEHQIQLQINGKRYPPAAFILRIN